MFEESMREVLNVNLFGTYFLTQLVANHMIRLIREGRLEKGKLLTSVPLALTQAALKGGILHIKGCSIQITTFADRLAGEK